jgi:hypothetical protein
MKIRELSGIGIGIIVAFFLSVCLITTLGILGISDYRVPLWPGNTVSFVNDSAESSPIELDVPLPESPVKAPFYRVVSIQSFDAGNGMGSVERDHLPSSTEAHGFAEKTLGQHRGLPSDAVFEKTSTVFKKNYNINGSAEEQFPWYTQVSYRQYVNGSPIINSGIAVSLGDKGEFLSLSKDWTTLEYAGEVSVIPADVAFEKLNRGDMLFRPQCCINGSRISRVRFGYYAETFVPDAMQTPSVNLCKPVWIFYAYKPGFDNEPIPLIVNATK